MSYPYGQDYGGATREMERAALEAERERERARRRRFDDQAPSDDGPPEGEPYDWITAEGPPKPVNLSVGAKSTPTEIHTGAENA